MHVWIIEFQGSTEKNWRPIVDSCKIKRDQVREELKWWKKNRPYWTLRIIKYTPTKGN